VVESDQKSSSLCNVIESAPELMRIVGGRGYGALSRLRRL